MEPEHKTTRREPLSFTATEMTAAYWTAMIVGLIGGIALGWAMRGTMT